MHDSTPSYFGAGFFFFAWLVEVVAAVPFVAVPPSVDALVLLLSDWSPVEALVVLLSDWSPVVVVVLVLSD